IGQSDSTTVNLRLEDSAEREGFFDLPDGLLNTLFEGQPKVLPAGEEAYVYNWDFPVNWYLGPGQTEIALWGYFPHMHQYGVSQRVRVLDGEGNEVACIGEVPSWDFDWQLYYFLQQPLMLQAGQRIEISCTYDTTLAEDGIWPGWGTYNEMCLAGLYLVP
ncbi:MAG: hypothetical protein KC431_09540, partial [Myxococcales bacterium]|nr:hypothetical protein [Myxococcales bacterium]